jgi:hypothetical protein
LHPSSFVMWNTPVEVQFTSAGCLNYPCRTPTVRRRPAGWRWRKHLHRQSVCWLDSPTGAPYRGEPRWVDRVGLKGGTHIVEALHCDVVQAPDRNTQPYRPQANASQRGLGSLLPYYFPIRSDVFHDYVLY